MPDNLIHHNNQGKVALKNLALKYFDSDLGVYFRKKIGFSSFGDCADNNYWRNYYNFLPEDFFDDLIRNDFLKKHRSLVDNKYKWSEQNLNIVFSFINLYVWYQIYFESSDCFSESSWKKIVENVS